MKYYGTGVTHVDGNCYPLLVMEYCTKTLADVVYDPSYNAPGACSKSGTSEFDAAMKVAARYTFEVSSGLMAIHQFGYLHRDLTPKNILVSMEFEHAVLPSLVDRKAQPRNYLLFLKLKVLRGFQCHPTPTLS